MDIERSLIKPQRTDVFDFLKCRSVILFFNLHMATDGVSECVTDIIIKNSEARQIHLFWGEDKFIVSTFYILPMPFLKEVFTFACY